MGRLGRREERGRNFVRGFGADFGKEDPGAQSGKGERWEKRGKNEKLYGSAVRILSRLSR